MPADFVCPNCGAILTDPEDPCPECIHNGGVQFCNCPACLENYGEERFSELGVQDVEEPTEDMEDASGE